MSHIETLLEEVKVDLVENILPYWMNTMVDTNHGGFFGRRNGYDELIANADKSVILNTRILWTFSHASRVLQDSKRKREYVSIANRAYEYLTIHFIDEENGGLYWMVNFQGQPVYTKKQVYAQAFGIYSFSEYYLATGSKEALDNAIHLFTLLEKHSHDKVFGGYFEAFDRDWNLLDDLRLSDKDKNESKTMNTHLHVLEAYTNLFRCWKDAMLEHQLKKLIVRFIETIINKNKHLQLFFDEQWNVKSTIISFGHDIEASWLLLEAAEVLGDKTLIKEIETLSLQLVDAVCKEGINANGALVNEVHENGMVDTDIHWWPQAEALVGFYSAYQITNDPAYLDKITTLWFFIKTHQIDNEKGEWHWRLKNDATPVRSEDKAGPWKCPYHNGRACMELISRTSLATL